MDAKDVRNLRWTTLDDWSELPASSSNRNMTYVSMKDMDIFIEHVCKKLSRQLNIPYEQLKPILEEENSAFFKFKREIFNIDGGTAYAKTHSLLKDLQSLFRIPVVSDADIDSSDGELKLCLKLYEGLSDFKKMVFLHNIGKIEVKVESIK